MWVHGEPHLLGRLGRVYPQARGSTTRGMGGITSMTETDSRIAAPLLVAACSLTSLAERAVLIE